MAWLLPLMGLLFAITPAEPLYAQISNWDTLDVHSPHTNITSVAQLNDRLFAAHKAGIGYSDDQGQSWLKIGNAPVQAHRVWTKNGKLYASRVLNGNDSTWVSHNEGQSFEFWGEIRSDLPSHQVIRGDTMYCIIKGSGLWVERVFRVLRGVPNMEILFQTGPNDYNIDLNEIGNRLLLLSTDGVRWSDDGGQNWTLSNSSLPKEYSPRLHVHQGVVYCYNQEKAVFRSFDAGENWEQLPFFTQNPAFLRKLVSEGPDLIATTLGDPFPGPPIQQWRSSDFGETWVQTYPQLYGNEENLIGFVTNAGKRFFTNKGCYAISENDSVWITQNHGLPQDAVQEAARLDETRWIMSDESFSKFYLSNNHGHNYRLVWMNPYYNILNLKAYGDTLMALGGGSGFMRSNDGGNTWLVEAPPNGSFVYQYCQEGPDQLLVSCSSGDLFRYSILNSSWQYLSSPGNLTAMTYSNGKLYVNGTQGVRISVDYGQSFTLHNNGLPSFFEGNKLFSINTNILATDFGSGLYLSQDEGMTWSHLTNPEDGGPYPPIENMVGKGQIWFAYNRFSDRVFYTLNAGKDWLTSPVPVQGFGPGQVTQMQQSGDSIFVFFEHNGIHYVIGQRNRGINLVTEPNDDFFEFRVIPNPAAANAETTVFFEKSLPDNTLINLLISDFSGKVQLQTQMTIEQNKATLPALPKGAYILNLTSGKSATSRVVITE